MTHRHVNILGTRGIPAAHGGFETFAAKLAPYLVAQGWTVNVYCQDDDGRHTDGQRDIWNGINRIFFHASRHGPVGTMEFDLKCARHVTGEPGIDLVLGYNTAVFNLPQRLRGRRVLMNMDGIEWKRSKWGFGPKAWFFLNELIGANLAHVPIADHPEIARHVSRRCFKRPVMIPYGSDLVEGADPGLLAPFGITPNQYFVSIARIEPENSILELVQGASRIGGTIKTVVLGKLDEQNAYHNQVRAAASDAVIFPGAIYDQTIVKALRFHALAYLHGHQVGGTNPSLVEALGAGNAVLAHDNRFNRWTAGPEQFYFDSADAVADRMAEISTDPERRSRAKQAAIARHAESFRWDQILSAYEAVLARQAALA
ncbi:MAG: DUF1972 domain-containing protein [Maritimibacter sp.]